MSLDVFKLDGRVALITGGNRGLGFAMAKALAEGAAAAGSQARYVETPEEAGEWLARELRPGDAVLLKASRGVKLEKALEKLQQAIKI